MTVPTSIILIHLRLVDCATKTHWTGPFQSTGVSWFLIIIIFIEISVFIANAVDPGQMRRFAGLCLHFYRCPFNETPGINGLSFERLC